MQLSRRFLERHWLAIMIMVVVGMVYGSRHFFVAGILEEKGERYHPVTVSGNYDEGMFYGPRANAVYRGALLAGDIEIQENRTSPAILPILNPLVMGGMGRLFGSLEKAFIVSDFLFPALIFFVLYLVAFELTSKRFLALTFVVVFVFVPRIFLAIPPVTGAAFREFVASFIPDASNVLYFARFEYPKVTFLFFALALYFIIRSLQRNERYASIAGGVAFGLLFYTYLYDWVYVGVSIGLTALFLAFQRNFTSMKQLLRILGVGILVSAFYWWNIFRLRSLPHYDEIVARIGVEVGRRLRLATAWRTYLRAIVLAFMAWVAYRKRRSPVTAYLISSIITIAVVLNLQIILGFNPQPDHWHRVQFLSVALAFLVVFDRFVLPLLRRFSPVIGKGIAVSVIFFMVGKSMYAQYAWSEVNAERYAVPKSYESSYEWLDAHVPAGTIVGSISPVTSSELLLYTAQKPFLVGGFNSTVPDETIWRRFAVMNAVMGMKGDEFLALLQDSTMVTYLFTDEFRNRSFDAYFRENERVIPTELKEEELKRYRAMVEQGKILGTPQYLYIGPREEKLIGREVREILYGEVVYRNEDLRLYRILR